MVNNNNNTSKRPLELSTIDLEQEASIGASPGTIIRKTGKKSSKRRNCGTKNPISLSEEKLLLLGPDICKAILNLLSVFDLLDLEEAFHGKYIGKLAEEMLNKRIHPKLVNKYRSNL